MIKLLWPKESLGAIALATVVVLFQPAGLSARDESHDNHNILDVIDTLAKTRESIAIPILSKIIRNPKYGDAARWRARYVRSSQFAPKAVVDIKLRLVQAIERDPELGEPQSAVVLIKLRNVTAKKISFSYTKLSDIFAPILAEERITKRSPPPIYRRFSSSLANDDAVHVSIAPGRAWTVHFNVDSAFPLDTIPYSNPALAVFVKLPGVHDVPQVSRGIVLAISHDLDDPFG